jgi:hypothetical protein
MSDTTKEQWPEGRDDKFWPQGDGSPYQGPDTQGGRIDLPQRDEPREAPEA